MLQTEMRKSGELQTEDELLRPPSTLSQYTGSMLKNVFMWVGSQVWAISGSAQSRIALPDHLIVTPLLQVESSLFLAYTHFLTFNMQTLNEHTNDYLSVYIVAFKDR